MFANCKYGFIKNVTLRCIQKVLGISFKMKLCKSKDLLEKESITGPEGNRKIHPKDHSLELRLVK